jgi:molybdopterin-containing oxidoreductase family iron-sulfur binding subunit
MERGLVDALVILGGNPAYAAPRDLEFARRLSRVPLRIRLSPIEDETASLCRWYVPEAHDLESWSDVRAFDGTASVVQPAIAPLYGGRSAHEILSILLGRPGAAPYDLVRETWAPGRGGREFERFWRHALHEGVIEGTAFPPLRVAAAPELSLPPPHPAAPLEIAFRPDPAVGDGRHANNAWLQELPKPVSHLTWDNAALVSPATARELGVVSRDRVELRLGGRSVAAPIWVLPGQADGTVTVHLGYGRTRAGRFGTGAGFDAYALRTSDRPGSAGGLEVRRLGGRHPLACTQEHHLPGPARPARLAGEELPAAEEGASLYPRAPEGEVAWGMSIDLNACTGCGACVVACQAENNVPAVGKAEVLRGREMHWLRIDSIHEGDPDRPDVVLQPMLCQHCEAAPCEVVCPVAATTHSAEGLNEQTYNRCVGTRYCSNNCPYKVRRFNFYPYAEASPPVARLHRNPDVTARSRGVMEKCTYCVQRINGARIAARKEDRSLRDGDVVTACEQACPSRAIVFGNVADPESRVSRLKRSPLEYGVLSELNTRPRTTYRARARRRHPDLEKE